jgi:hypothetical protein
MYWTAQSRLQHVWRWYLENKNYLFFTFANIFFYYLYVNDLTLPLPASWISSPTAISPKRRYVSTTQHGVTSQTAVIFTVGSKKKLKALILFVTGRSEIRTLKINYSYKCHTNCANKHMQRNELSSIRCIRKYNRPSLTRHNHVPAEPFRF